MYVYQNSKFTNRLYLVQIFIKHYQEAIQRTGDFRLPYSEHYLNMFFPLECLFWKNEYSEILQNEYSEKKKTKSLLTWFIKAWLNFVQHWSLGIFKYGIHYL